MLKNKVQAEPEQPGRIAELRAEVTRKAQALVSEPGSIYAQYEAYQNQLAGLLQASADLSQPIDADITREATITALRRRLLALDPLLEAERAAREQAHTEYLAAAAALREAEILADGWRANLAAADRDTRKIMAYRDHQRSQIVAELNRLIGGSTAVLPHPATYEIP
jgi:hypothetical protein